MKRLIGLFAAMATAALTLTCTVSDLFSEYDGQSFLSTTSLQSDNWELMPDYSFETGTTAEDYMDYSLESATGGPNGGPVYRLEIKNLLQNGDFEDTSASPAYSPWFIYDEVTPEIVASPAASVIDVITGTNEISNRTVFFSTDTGYRAAIKLKDSFVNPETYISDQNYVFNFSYRTASIIKMFFEPDWSESSGGFLDTYGFQSSGGAGGSQEDTSLSNNNIFAPIDPELAEARGPNVFGAQNTSYPTLGDTWTFATDKSQSGYFDNFRIVRDTAGDFDLRLRLKLDLDHRQDLELIPGYYRFSVYVKDETITSLNTFNSDRVELSITGYDTSNQISTEDSQVFYKDETLHDLYSQSGEGYTGDWSSSWIQLVLASDKLIQLPNISQDPVMELTISPSNPGTSDAGWNRLTAGSVLISEPVLEYSSTPWD
ncbi:hypothetical protein EXM22_15575 [Oceanispirochaeta crateris]|uniref:Uncharacterized protein n=1 Tax=Oceanispirochaeta crateris TaxID=2518645 RepID=A0A5C1QPR5_9SPIO|nr:hypothetical protein [Oceanispirochaeta crateris]QEN09328.1 hypothetical protein EXM22_15575 [Oceanispirochaeta crateris]